MLKKMRETVWTKWKKAMKPGFKVKLTRRNLFISLPANQGGEFHVLPRPGLADRTSFSVAVVDGLYELQMQPGAVRLADFPTEWEARSALMKLNKILTGNQIFKWLFRLAFLWLAWLFITSYMQVSQQTASNSTASSAATNPQFIPPADAGLQDMPSVPGGDVSNYIYQQAMAAKRKAEHDDMPPSAGAATAGLDGFGLNTDAQQQGPSNSGCDPKLAFKVPK